MERIRGSSSAIFTQRCVLPPTLFRVWDERSYLRRVESLALSTAGGHVWTKKEDLREARLGAVFEGLLPWQLRKFHIRRANYLVHRVAVHRVGYLSTRMYYCATNLVVCVFLLRIVACGVLGSR